MHSPGPDRLSDTPGAGADDVGAYVFRRKVAAHLEQHWNRRASALRNCGDAGVKLRCDCGVAHLVPYRCGARSCPVCAHIVSAQAVERLAARAGRALAALNMAETWDGIGPARRKGWKLFTATSRAHAVVARRYEADRLLERIRRVRGAWGPFWRSTSWGARVNRWVERDTVDPATGEVIATTRRRSKVARRDTMASMGIEVAPGGMVHLHAAVYGEWIGADELARLWGAAMGEPAFVKIKAMKATRPEDFRKALREVLKYVTKWDKAVGVREQRAAAIEAAMRGVRRVDNCGALRKVQLTDGDVAAAEPESCTACGSSGAWKWVRVWTPEEVRGNGGFGIVRAPIDAAERRQWREEQASDVGRRTREWITQLGEDADAADPPHLDDGDPFAAPLLDAVPTGGAVILTTGRGRP